MIDSDLILALLKEIELEKLADMLESYFDEWNKVIPDELAELYVTIDTAKLSIMGNFNEYMTDEDYSSLAQAIYDFRRWYVLRRRPGVRPDPGDEGR